MKNTSRYIIFICCWFIYNIAPAQTFNLSIDENLPKCIEEDYYSNPKNHTVIRPLQIDILKYQHLLDSCFSNKEKKQWLFDENFVEIKNEKNGFILNPVLTDFLKTNNGFILKME